MDRSGLLSTESSISTGKHSRHPGSNF